MSNSSNDDSKNDNLVVFLPSGKRGRFKTGSNLLDISRDLGIDLDSSCGGIGNCGKCQVTPVFGNFSKFGIVSKESHISSLSETEKVYFAENPPYDDNNRLSCSSVISGDLVIDVPESSQTHSQVVRKSSQAIDVLLDSSVSLYYLEVSKPTLELSLSDDDLVRKALKDQWDVDSVDFDLDVLKDLSSFLRDNNFKITVAIHNSSSGSLGNVIALYGGLKEDIYGLSLDLGSTTVSCHLVSLITGNVIASSGVMNPQIKFGEDLMSRISYIMMNKDSEKAMTSVVIDAISDLISNLITQANSSGNNCSSSELLDIVVVCNPIMHHLFLGLNPKELGFSPFSLTVSSSLNLRAQDLCILNTHKNARVYILPCIGGHVGADCAGVILSSKPYDSKFPKLIVDIGTNAEIVFGNKDKLYVCSSPTGPAFEGAQISSGVRASVGAIERVRIDNSSLEPKFKIIGCDDWLSDSNLNKLPSGVSISGICGSGIIEVIAGLYLSGIVRSDGLIDGANFSSNPRLIKNGNTWNYLLCKLGDGVGDILVTQDDIRSIQLAKAALWSGCKLLEDYYGSKAYSIELAGAFGSHIDLKYAMILGLLPDCSLDRVSSIGNAAGSGATIALLSLSSRRKIENVVLGITKIETATESKFQDYFLNATAIPNKLDNYLELQKTVALPKPLQSVSRTSRGRRNR